MEKLPWCRICLAENVRMHAVVDKNMHKLYKMLTNITFVTDDRRPILACIYCYAKLKQCYQLQRKCLEAEELLDLVMYEHNPVINRGELELFNGYVITPMENINIVVNIDQIENIPVKQELLAGCERLDDFIDRQVEHQSEDLQLENVDNVYSDAENKPPAERLKSNSENDDPLATVGTDVGEEQTVSKRKRQAYSTERANVAKKPKKVIRRNKRKNTITAQRKKTEQSHLMNTLPSVNNSIINTSLVINFRNNSNTGTDSNDMKKNLRSCIKNKPFKCEICQSSFADKTALTLHIRVHTGEKPYKCDICQSRFALRGSLIRHIRVHTGEKPFKCDICHRSFKQKYNLTMHTREHSGEKPFKCDICQHSFVQKSHLTQHIRIHAGETPYKCEICQHRFFQKIHLTQHIRVHTGEKPYKCDICQHCFVQKSHLTQHIRVHTGEKPYKCEICQCRFTRKTSLTRHIRIHTGEKANKCEKCARSYRNKRDLTKHMLLHAGKKLDKSKLSQRHSVRKS